MNTADLIEALLNPESYPHPVDVITTIETHISVVFLTGQYAYKLKKPVNFGFLDFSPIANRKKYCKLEVKLNRRTAPQLYLQALQVEVSDKKNTVKLSEISDESKANKDIKVVDYLVQMKQFNPNHVLGRLLKQTPLSLEMSESLASQIAAFHKQADPVSNQAEYGDPSIQLQPMLDNFPSLTTHFNDSVTQDKLSQLLNWTQTQFSRLKPLMQQRKKQGFVRACHGDLHLDNIALIDGQPVLFDGIEFNEYFRWIDVFSDIAFLLSDLDYQKQAPASCQTLSLYLSQTLDYNGLFLLNFYRVYRTMVRAKITALRADQLQSNPHEYQQVNQTAIHYIDQALSYTQPCQKPKCILLQGVSGSGKSFFANQLLEQLNGFNAIIISSDRIRKTLFGIAPHQRVSATEKTKLYSNEMNKRTYQALAEHTKTCLELGLNVIVDATFLKRSHRKTFKDLANSFSAPFYVFSLQANTETAKNLIQTRQKLNNNPSDASVDIMLHQKQVIELPDASENALILNTETLKIQFPTQVIQEYLNLPIT